MVSYCWQNAENTFGFETPSKEACKSLHTCCNQHLNFFKLVQTSSQSISRSFQKNVRGTNLQPAPRARSPPQFRRVPSRRSSRNDCKLIICIASEFNLNVIYLLSFFSFKFVNNTLRFKCVIIQYWLNTSTVHQFSIINDSRRSQIDEIWYARVNVGEKKTSIQCWSLEMVLFASNLHGKYLGADFILFYFSTNVKCCLIYLPIQY